MATTSADLYDDGHDWAQFSADERESFFAAIARHRRMSWRVTAVSALAIAIATLVVGVLTAPLFYAVIGIVFDLVNLAVPTPNVLGGVLDTVDAITNGTASAAVWVRFALFAIAPGVVWVSVLLFALNRALRQAATLDAAELKARPPTPHVLAEQRFANVVSEMSIAAGLTPPRLLVTKHGHNASIIGTDDEHATIAISESLLSRLNRSELQGVAAHLVGSLANGDVAIGLRSSLVLCFFGVLGRLTSILSVDRTDSASSFGAMLRPLVVPTKEGARKLMAMIHDPFAPTDEEKKNGRANDKEPTTLLEKIRAGAKMMLMGPVVMTGFFGGIVSQFFLGSMLAFAWRQRKYLADATAVRLTRDPDTLGHALQKMGGGGTIDAWTDHLSVSHRGAGSKFGMMVPMFPSLERRLTALQKLGSTVTFKREPRRLPLGATILIGVLSSIAGILGLVVLPLLAWVSVALSMLFLGMPVGVLHVLLRWLGQS
jgi:Zn-dependent protease with chaperone function